VCAFVLLFVTHACVYNTCSVGPGGGKKAGAGGAAGGAASGAEAVEDSAASVATRDGKHDTKYSERYTQQNTKRTCGTIYTHQGTVQRLRFRTLPHHI
jgi:hypothetical protein